MKSVKNFYQFFPIKHIYCILTTSLHTGSTPWPVGGYRILTIPGIPSRYSAASTHTVVLAYIPTSRAVVQPSVGYKSQELQRIGMFICGPRITGPVAGRCRIGARVSTPCAHVITGIYAAGVVAHQPQLFRSTWRSHHYLDCAVNRPMSWSTDMVTGLFQ